MNYKEVLQLSAADLKTLLSSLQEEICRLNLTRKTPSSSLKKAKSLRSSIAMILTRMRSDSSLKDNALID